MVLKDASISLVSFNDKSVDDINEANGATLELGGTVVKSDKEIMNDQTAGSFGGMKSIYTFYGDIMDYSRTGDLPSDDVSGVVPITTKDCSICGYTNPLRKLKCYGCSARLLRKAISLRLRLVLRQQRRLL